MSIEISTGQCPHIPYEGETELRKQIHLIIRDHEDSIFRRLNSLEESYRIESEDLKAYAKKEVVTAYLTGIFIGICAAVASFVLYGNFFA